MVGHARASNAQPSTCKRPKKGCSIRSSAERAGLVLDNDLGWSVGAEVSLLAEKILSITKSDIDLKLS